MTPREKRVERNGRVNLLLPSFSPRRSRRGVEPHLNPERKQLVSSCTAFLQARWARLKASRFNISESPTRSTTAFMDALPQNLQGYLTLKKRTPVGSLPLSYA